MYMVMMGFIVAAVLGIVLLLVFWVMRKQLKSNPKVTIIITMVSLIFAISLATIAKTYLDYDKFLSAEYSASPRLIQDIVFALFLDFTVLIIGGLFLYLANQLYLSKYVQDSAGTSAPSNAGKKPSGKS